MANIEFQFSKNCQKKLPFSRNTDIAIVSENMGKPSVWLRCQDTDNTGGLCYIETCLDTERHGLTHNETESSKCKLAPRINLTGEAYFRKN